VFGAGDQFAIKKRAATTAEALPHVPDHDP